MKVGDKVVCVDDSPCRCSCHKGEPCSLILNHVYVVEGLTETDGVSGLLLYGKRDDRHKFNFAYSANRFRLLDELKQEARERQQTSTCDKRKHWQFSGPIPEPEAE